MALITLNNQSLTAISALPALATSSGIYLGGTGSANYLDDYEEGTWTPEILASVSNPTLTYNSTQRYGRYTKIGNTVIAQCQMRIDAVSGGSGSLWLSGLPFNMASSSAGGAAMSGWAQNWNSNFSIGFNSSVSYWAMYKNGLVATPVTVSDLKNANDSNQFEVTLVYEIA